LGLALLGAAFAETPKSVSVCPSAGDGWCRARRFPGTVPRGELGFRFGEPRDVDGDGHADVAAGARFKLRSGTLQSGDTTVWSGATGAPIRTWEGDLSDGLFGHWVLLVADLSGDGRAGVIVAAPHAPVEGRMRGVVTARSITSGDVVWTRAETEGENYGWDLAVAGDQDGDGIDDLFVGAPSEHTGHVDLVSGKTGAVLRRYAPRGEAGSFGWYVARLGDLDRDGKDDLAVGAPFARSQAGVVTGGAWIYSAGRGTVLHQWKGTDPRGGFGVVVAAVSDLDGDGNDEIAVSAAGTEDQSRSLPGEVVVYGGGTWRVLRRWNGRQPGEQYGRMVVAAGDVDGDRRDDVAIGAPWHRTDAGDRVGRVEIRSGRTDAVLADLLGDAPDGWFGWHVRRAPDPDGRGRPALLIGSLRHPIDSKVGVGVLDLLVRDQGMDPGMGHGTTTRGARRKDIK
jgi:hypothetical protein